VIRGDVRSSITACNEVDGAQIELHFDQVICTLGERFAEFFVFQFAIKKYKIYRTMVVRIVLYGCETWSLTLRKEHRLRVFENSVLRRNFGVRGTR
jgi:hypothetical protein